MAENIVMLVVTPTDTVDVRGSGRYGGSEIAPKYVFDSNDGGGVGAHNGQQVPPLMRITMVAIDESTSVRLDDSGKLEPRDLFGGMSLFNDSDDYDKDISKLIEHFDKSSRDEDPINYRIFSTVVMLRAAKWVSDNGPSTGGGGN